MHLAAPRLTVSILTRDGEPRLERLLAEVAEYADEIVVGVDASSVDRTFEIATAHADVVYRFRHGGQLAAARMLPFAYASGDWLLSLDDDESLEPSFDELVPGLLADDRVTHYRFPRKWVVDLEPGRYIHEPPWFPDWQLRLFRNDRRLVWKPHRPHSGYQVQGPGAFEERVSILHFEPMLCSAEARLAKVERYRLAGAIETGQQFFDRPAGLRVRPVTPRVVGAAPARPAGCAIQHDVVDAIGADLSPWRAAIIGVDMPDSCPAAGWMIAEVTAANTGALAWSPPAGRWPVLQLGAKVLNRDGEILTWDGARTPVPRFVAPGDSVTFICALQAPDSPGPYLIEWDLVSEHECWFAQCGGTTQRALLEVTAEPSAD